MNTCADNKQMSVDYFVKSSGCMNLCPAPTATGKEPAPNIAAIVHQPNFHVVEAAVCPKDSPRFLTVYLGLISIHDITLLNLLNNVNKNLYISFALFRPLFAVLL